jgi:hypothetical protein
MNIKKIITQHQLTPHPPNPSSTKGEGEQQTRIWRSPLPWWVQGQTGRENLEADFKFSPAYKRSGALCSPLPWR